MRRRHLLTALGATLTSLPTVAATTVAPVIGYLGSASAESTPGGVMAGLHRGLAETGYVEGRNLTIEFRWAEGRYDRLAAMAAELVARRVDAIVAASLPAAVAAKAATAAIPIVFVMGADPVKQGLVAGLARPGGNVTGVTSFFGSLGAKRLELLRELVSNVGTIAVISNPRNPNAEDHLHGLQAAAAALGSRIAVLTASSTAEIELVLAGLGNFGALLLADDPLFTLERQQIVAKAAEARVPAIYYLHAFTAAGGLISYGSNSRENYRLAGTYLGRILKGSRPADLPVLQPTAFELVINVRTARALGLVIPPGMLARADVVIE